MCSSAIALNALAGAHIAIAFSTIIGAHGACAMWAVVVTVDAHLDGMAAIRLNRGKLEVGLFLTHESREDLGQTTQRKVNTNVDYTI